MSKKRWSKEQRLKYRQSIKARKAVTFDPVAAMTLADLREDEAADHLAAKAVKLAAELLRAMSDEDLIKMVKR